MYKRTNKSTNRKMTGAHIGTKEQGQLLALIVSH